MIYLASPYSHKDPVVMDQRFADTQRAVALWIKSGLFIFSPIVYTHEIAVTYSLPKDHLYWEGFNLYMLSVAKELWVLKLDGWQESAGINFEMNKATEWHLPVVLKDIP